MNMPAKLERYVAASAYIFELGYILLNWLKFRGEISPFLKFHLRQATRLIILAVFASASLLLVVFTKTNVAMLITIAIAFILIYLILGGIGAYYALKGKTKKVFF